MTYRARHDDRGAMRVQFASEVRALTDRFYDLTSAVIFAYRVEPGFYSYASYRSEFPHVSLNTKQGKRHLKNWLFHRAREHEFQHYHGKSYRSLT